MTTSLFAYGTLEIPQVLRAVTGRSFPSSEAWLPGHARFLLRGRPYPGITPDERHEVAGILYGELDEAAMALLDRFEGDCYRRETVRVRTPSHRSREAQTYVVTERHRLLLSTEPWDRDAFVAHHLADFLAVCSRFGEAERYAGQDPAERR